MLDAGTYALVIRVQQKLSIKVGRLGVCTFLPGYYIYAGSALKGLNARLERHRREEKKMFWHIDYLLEHAEINEIWYCLSTERLECRWNTAITKLPGAEIAVKNFGSSDCKCLSHLTRFVQKPSFADFQKALKLSGWPEALLKLI